MIRYATTKDLPALAEMWRLCFQDKDEFIRFYFDRIYRNTQTLIFLKNHSLVASLQLIPYKVKIEEDTHAAAYVSGAMTHPEHRRNGYMGEVLLFAFDEMKKKGIPYSFLIPQEKWLFDFYEKFGYKKAFPLALSRIEFSDSEANARIFQEEKEIDLQMVYATYIRLLKRNSEVILKTKKQFEILLQDHFMENGQVVINSNGVCFFFQKGTKIFIRELLSKDEKTKQELLAAIKKNTAQNHGTLLSHSISEKFRYYGMMKAIDPTFPLHTNSYMSMMLD